MADSELEAAARQLINDAAQKAEEDLMERLRGTAFEMVFARVRAGLRTQVFFNLPVGKQFAARCMASIENACTLWLTTNDDDVIAKAKIEAQGAIAALSIFADTLADAKEAEHEMRQLDPDFQDETP
jgi:hypothetical protein